MTSRGLPWHYAAFGVAAGLGTGYVLGVLSARWLWLPVVRPAARAPATAAAARTSELVNVIAEIVTEMGRLRQALERGVICRGFHASSSIARTVDSTADFASARGDFESEAEDEFYDPDSETEAE